MKLLINTKFKQSLHFNKKVVTNKASYNLNLHSFEGDISEIIKIGDRNGMGYNNLPLTSDFRSWFSTIYNLRKKMGMRSSDMNSFLQIQSKEGSQDEMLNNESIIQKEDKVISAPSVKVKSIIVNNHRKPSELIQEEKAVRKHKSKKNKRTCKRNSRYRMDSDEDENKTITETKADICENQAASSKGVISVNTSNMEQQVLIDSNRSDPGNILSSIREEEIVIEEPTTEKIRVIGVLENDDIVEWENSLLINPQSDKVEDNILSKEEKQMEQHHLQDIAIKSTPCNKSTSFPSKFWQTPVAYASSPFTLEDNLPDKGANGKMIVGSITKEVQNFLNEDMDMIPEVEILNSEDKDLDQLTEELIQVFSLDNINHSTDSQKEALIQRILKLVGSNS